VCEPAGLLEKRLPLLDPYHGGVDFRKHLQDAAQAGDATFSRSGGPAQLCFGERPFHRGHEAHGVRLQYVVDGATAQSFDGALLAERA
jgi:hypothetical protein